MLRQQKAPRYFWEAHQSAYSNQTITTDAALYIGNLIPLAPVGAVTNSYAIYANAQSGATNNYAATFMGGNVGIGQNRRGPRLTLKEHYDFPARLRDTWGFSQPPWRAVRRIPCRAPTERPINSCKPTGAERSSGRVPRPVRPPRLRRGRARSRLPASLLQGDTGTGLYDVSSGIAGLAAGGKDVLRLNSAANAVNYSRHDSGGRGFWAEPPGGGF